MHFRIFLAVFLCNLIKRFIILWPTSVRLDLFHPNNLIHYLMRPPRPQGTGTICPQPSCQQQP